MEHHPADPESFEDQTVAVWLRRLRALRNRHEFSDATLRLLDDGTMPQGNLDTAEFIGDLVRNNLFDELEAVLASRPFDLGYLSVEAEWFADDVHVEPTRLLRFLRVLRETLLCEDFQPPPLYLVFRQVRWGPQEALYWIDCMPQSTCPLLLAYESCDFGDEHDGMLESALQAPQLCELTLELASDLSSLSVRFCSLLREHRTLTCLRLPSMSVTLCEALPAALDGNKSLKELRVCLKDVGAYDGILQSLRGHPRLKTLELGGITAQDAHALAMLSSMPGLKNLLLQSMGDDAVVPPTAFEHLKRLWIKSPVGARHGEPARSILTALSRSPRLKMLEWSHACILVQHKSLVSAWMREAGRLKTLHLDRAIGDTCQLVLDGLAFNASIESLKFISCAAVALPSISLAGVIGHPSLEFLEIQHSPLTELACKQFAQLIGERSVLRRLTFLNCPFGPAGLKIFCAALEDAPTLLMLDSNGSFEINQLGEVLKAIQRNRSLMRLSLWPAAISLEQLSREWVEECLRDQFALLELDDWAGAFDEEATELLEALLERNRQATDPNRMAQWRLAVKQFIAKSGHPTDIAEHLWNKLVQTLPGAHGGQREVPRSRDAWLALKALHEVGRLPD